MNVIDVISCAFAVESIGAVMLEHDEHRPSADGELKSTTN